MLPKPQIPTLPDSDPDVFDQLRSYLLELNPELDTVDPDLDIIENRIVDSLQLVGFLVFIEQLRGTEIPEASVNQESFRTLRTIQERFF